MTDNFDDLPDVTDSYEGLSNAQEAGHEEDEVEFDVETDDGDDGGDGSEGGDEQSSERGGRQPREQEADEAPQRLSRASKAVLKAKEDARRESERAQQLERQLAEISAREQYQRQQQQYAEEQQRRQYMTPEELVIDDLRRQVATQAQQIQATQYQTRDMNDRSEFNMFASENPAARKLRSEVEAIYQNELRIGRFTPRQDIYYHLYGKQISSQASKARSRAQAEGSAKVKRQTVKAVSSSSSVSAPSNRGRGAAQRSIDWDSLDSQGAEEAFRAKYNYNGI